MALSHLVRTLALNSLVTLEKDIVFSIICHLRANFQVTVLRPLFLFVCNALLDNLSCMPSLVWLVEKFSGNLSLV